MTGTELARALGHAHERFVSLRPRVEAGAPWPLAVRFDHSDEAAWGPPELLAHVAEMLPFWLGEIERILDGGPEPVPFGRVGTDEVRIALIGRDRTLPLGVLFARTADGARLWSERLSSLGPEELTRRGLHSRLGEMSVDAIVERFVVGHLDDHARQLGEIVG